MKALIWNCRGLGALRSVHACQKLVRKRRPSLVFLMESKLKNGEAEKIKNKLGYENAFWVDCKGEGRRRAGGWVFYGMRIWRLT